MVFLYQSSCQLIGGQSHDEDWDILKTLLPNDWKSLAVDTNALKGLLKDKSEEAIKIVHKKLKRHTSKKGIELKPETFIYAKYAIVFATFPGNQFTAFDILEWYRILWQIELAFKRFKQIAQFGYLPKYDDDSSKSWLYGKLFAVLLTERLIDFAKSFPPGIHHVPVRGLKANGVNLLLCFIK